jgi:hypothetical protein|tara:strand:+ start:46 stop:306 length:261 start_codon:yes stop_codon:yes gene_type:complete
MSDILKITPKYDKSWYVKWSATLLALASVALNSIPLIPLNFAVGVLAGAGWTLVGIWWHDRALILLNGVITFMYFMGGVNYMVTIW